MKVYLNRAPINGPWGGGNKCVTAVSKALETSGHEVVYELVDGIDAILCFDPRPSANFASYEELLLYKSKNSNCKLVQRVGDIGTHGKPELSRLVTDSVLRSDTAIFPSRWAHDSILYALEISGKRPTVNWHVVANAPSPVFYQHRDLSIKTNEKLRLITHHWSTNSKKGFDFYERLAGDLGSLLNVEFSYVGRLPEGFEFSGYKGVMSDFGIASELPTHDVYVTASLQEAGANHVLEAIACGLPVIYHTDGGSIVEYACQFGQSFDGSLTSFEDALSSVKAQFSKLKNSIKKYRRTIDDVALEYVWILEGITCQKV